MACGCTIKGCRLAAIYFSHRELHMWHKRRGEETNLSRVHKLNFYSTSCDRIPLRAIPFLGPTIGTRGSTSSNRPCRASMNCDDRSQEQVMQEAFPKQNSKSTKKGTSVQESRQQSRSSASSHWPRREGTPKTPSAHISLPRCIMN